MQKSKGQGFSLPVFQGILPVDRSGPRHPCWLYPGGSGCPWDDGLHPQERTASAITCCIT